MVLDRKILIDVFVDPYNVPIFSNRFESNGTVTWRIGGLGFVDESQLIELVLAAVEPKPIPLWWEFWKTTSTMNEIEDIARRHIWLVRQQVMAMTVNRHAIMQYRFKSLALLDKLLKEAHRD